MEIKKIIAVCLTVFFASQTVFSQNASDPVIFEINGEKIYKSEFVKDFLQSIGKTAADAPTPCTYEKRKALEDYANLYVNFRCKLADAYRLGLDTRPELVRELRTYREELAAPYLIDSATMNEALREAYERNHYAIHAAHILINIAPDATPDDTLKCLERAEQIYRRVTSGEDFTTVAQEVVAETNKNNPGYKPNPNEGDLGYFTVFNMVYPFETAAYNLKPGEISRPVRTRFGYHIIKVINRLEYYGRPTIAHIWVRGDIDSLRAVRTINNYYKRLQDGEPFERVARGSDDHGTAGLGGELKNIEMSRIPPEYVEHIAGLKEGEYSEPFRTSFGWHIVKLIKADAIPSFEEMMPYYKQRFSRDQRASAPQNVFIANAKVKYNFVDNTQPEYTVVKKKKKVVREATASLAEIRSLLTDSVFSGTWKCNDDQITDLRPLFVIGDTSYNAVQFMRYIRKTQEVEASMPLDEYLQKKYNRFIDGRVLMYADSKLEQEHPEFADLVDSYRHGLMIFKYNDTMVWSKAIYDTVGFAEFYAVESEKKSMADSADAVFFWGWRARITTIAVDDSATLSPKKASRIIMKSVKKGWGNNDLRDALEAAADKSKRSQGRIKVETDMVEKGLQEVLKDNEWTAGIYSRSNGTGYKYVIVEKVLEPCLKDLSEARGFYLNDYQNEVERRLNESLRKKYNVKIHQNVIDEITY